MASDHYKTLGVAEDANAEDIKKSFRKLAKKYHPDRNKDNKAAEARFKEITEAYDTLSDPKKKSEYDMMRQYGFPGSPTGQNPYGGAFRQAGPGGVRFEFSTSGSEGFSGLEDIFSELFGGRTGQRGQSPFGARTGQRQSKGSDIHSQISITFMESVKGAQRMLALPGGKKLRVKIPAGIDNNGKIRLAGQGQPGYFESDSGDLIITVQVMTDQNFERKGNDIYTSVTIPFTAAILGTKVNVKTLSKTISLSVPAGSQPGTKLRLKGQGLVVGSKHGDLFVEIKVTLPKTLTDEQKKIIEEWGE